jgi:hypothetical protein
LDPDPDPRSIALSMVVNHFPGKRESFDPEFHRIVQFRLQECLYQKTASG